MIDFRKSKPQGYRDPWRGNKIRILRFRDKCVGCGSRCYGFDDGENDPRGILGEKHSADWLEPHASNGLEYAHVACFACMNDEPRYLFAIKAAQRRERQQLRIHRPMAAVPPVEGRDFAKVTR